MADYMDDESGPSQAEDASVSNGSNDTKEDKSDETEDQLALVPTSFFQKKSGTPKPGMREMVEVVEVYENEVSIKCVYGDKDDEKKEESESVPAEEAEDEMMS